MIFQLLNKEPMTFFTWLGILFFLLLGYLLYSGFQWHRTYAQEKMRPSVEDFAFIRRLLMKLPEELAVKKAKAFLKVQIFYASALMLLLLLLGDRLLTSQFLGLLVAPSLLFVGLYIEYVYE